MEGKIRGCRAGEARPTPPIFFLTPAKTKELNFGLFGNLRDGEKKELHYKSNQRSRRV
jgi:hypothetical protein